ncbi:MAG: DUF4037 domain-containing protein [Chloroflexota bacterium]
MTDLLAQPDPVRRLVAAYAALPEVRAIGLAGSSANGAADADSDIDVYIFQSAVIIADVRQRIARTMGAPAHDLQWIGLDPGADEFHDGPTGVPMDLLLWDLGWLSDRVAANTERHQAELGYSTALWHTAARMQVLHDPSGDLAALIARASVPYPDALRREVITRNTDVLRRTQASYRRQLEKAIARDDLVSINHRVAAFIASAMDVVFAANRALHPGEKRLLALIERDRLRTPEGYRAKVEAFVRAASDAHPELPARADDLGEAVERFAAAELER